MDDQQEKFVPEDYQSAAGEFLNLPIINDKGQFQIITNNTDFMNDQNRSSMDQLTLVGQTMDQLTAQNPNSNIAQISNPAPSGAQTVPTSTNQQTQNKQKNQPTGTGGTTSGTGVGGTQPTQPTSGTGGAGGTKPTSGTGGAGGTQPTSGTSGSGTSAQPISSTTGTTVTGTAGTTTSTTKRGTKFFDLFRGSVQSQIQNLIPKQKDTDGYKVGQFSQFAKKIQKQMNTKNAFIRKTIKEAVISYEMKLKQNFQEMQKLLGITELSDKSPFLTQQQIKQFMKDEVQFYLKRYNALNISNFLVTHANRRKYLFKTAMIDGKLVQITKLKLGDRFYNNGSLYLSTQVKNLYIKLDNTKKPVKVIFKRGRFLEEKDFIIDSESIKEQIMGMVILFLKSRDIILQQDEIEKVKVGIEKQINVSQNGTTTTPAQKP